MRLHAGDALSICFNTVAILFLADIDNALFATMLPERLRVRIEEVGHVELGDAEAAALARTKPIHTALILVTVLGSVAIGGVDGDGAAVVFTALTFWVGGVAEAFGAGRSVCDVCKRIGWATGASLLGFVVLVLVFVLVLS